MPKKNVKRPTKEVTRIITAKITIIEKDVQDSPTKEQLSKEIITSIKKKLGVDDVVVTEVKDFVNEK